MNEPTLNLIPTALRELPQWVLWNVAERDGKQTKLPVQTSGQMAKSNDPETWTDFDSAAERFAVGGFTGIGFMFSADDPYCGIDLDGCRDTATGKVADWAREVIVKFGSYAEVSPSQTGVKIFCRGSAPFASGRKLNLPESLRTGDKAPAIEVYDKLRYFAMTGWRLNGCVELKESQASLSWLKKTYWPEEPAAPVVDFQSDAAVFERARKYLAKLPPAVSGQNGHGATFHAACVLVLGFQLPVDDALSLMRDFNQGCNPQWSEKELLHKVKQADKQPGQRGYLRNTAPGNWQRISVPTYQEPLSKPEPRQTTLAEAARSYLKHIQEGKAGLLSMSVPDLDYALGGGAQLGEMVIFAARPSHGKSAVALQCVHHWTEAGIPCAMVSEEMSALMLGKRSLQFLSAIPEEHWPHEIVRMESAIDEYEKMRKACIILEGCGTTEAACEGIERAVRDHGVQCAVVDYAQLLRAPGRDRYQQVTNTSLMLRQLASHTKILLLVLCQMSRDIEKRHGEFLPVMADIKETGQLEQDADIVTFLCWPHRLDKSEPLNKYQFFVAKNRNRAIRDSCVVCRFIPDRQMVLDAQPSGVSPSPSWMEPKSYHEIPN